MAEDPARPSFRHVLLGSTTEPERFKCGGWTGCDEDHAFLAPVDVLVMNEAMLLEEFRESHHWTKEAEAEAVANRTLYVGTKAVIPTMLGMWYEDCAAN